MADEARTQQIINAQRASQTRVAFSKDMADGITTFPYILTGGATGSGYYLETPPTVEILGSTSEVGTTSPLGINTLYNGFVQVGNLVYILNGLTGAFYSYNIDTNVWTVLATAPSQAQYSTPVVQGGKIYIMTYYNGTAHVMNAPLVYDITGGTWSTLTAPTGSPATVYIYSSVADETDANIIYVMLDANVAATDRLWSYNIATNTYTVMTPPHLSSALENIVYDNGYLYYIAYNDNSLYRYKLVDGVSELVKRLYSTHQVYRGFLFKAGGLIYAGSDYVTIATVINTATGITQFMYRGTYPFLNSYCTSQSTFEHQGKLYSFMPYNYAHDLTRNVYSDRVLSIDLSLPHFYNLTKEV